MRRGLAALLALIFGWSCAFAETIGVTGGPATPQVVGNSTVWYAGNSSMTPGSGVTQSSGTIACLPIFLPVAQHWDRLAVNIATLSAGGNAQLAVYAGGLDATTGRVQPQGAPLANSTNLGTGSTGNLTWSISPTQAVGPGMVFGCLAYGDATMVFSTYQGAGSVAGLLGVLTETNSMIPALRGLTYAGSFGTWPNFTGVTMTESIGTGIIPVFGYRVSTVP